MTPEPGEGCIQAHLDTIANDFDKLSREHAYYACHWNNDESRGQAAAYCVAAGMLRAALTEGPTKGRG